MCIQAVWIKMCIYIQAYESTDVDEMRKKKRAAGSLSRESEIERWLPCLLLFDRQDRHPFFLITQISKKGKEKKKKNKNKKKRRKKGSDLFCYSYYYASLFLSSMYLLDLYFLGTTAIIVLSSLLLSLGQSI